MKIFGWAIISLFLGLSGCSGDKESNPETKQMLIKLNCGITTRATDKGFENGDCIGLYVVNYNGNSPEELKHSGNHADNAKFSQTFTWIPEKQLFWKDETTPADFYCYYPYTSNLSTITAYLFEVKADQTNIANYKASDFLWGKTAKVSPTESAVKITTQHLFSCAQIKLEPGDGFTAESLATADIVVKINHTRTKATIDLTTGVATVTGEPQTTLPTKEGNIYKAIIVPQEIAQTDMIVVNVDKKDYTLNKAFTFEANKKYTFTIRVNKTNNGVNIGIGKWEEDETDHGGAAE